MAESRSNPRPYDNRDIARVTAEVVKRLSDSGIDASDAESPEELVRLVDAVEGFERAVMRRGGDLMVDEPPVDEAPQPDDPLFLLPTRRADESISSYIRRLDDQTAEIHARRR